MGRVYLGDTIRLYKKALQLYPDEAEAYRRLGYIYWKRVKELPQVIPFFSRSLELAPAQPQAEEMRQVRDQLIGMYNRFNAKISLESADRSEVSYPGEKED